MAQKVIPISPEIHQLLKQTAAKRKTSAKKIADLAIAAWIADLEIADYEVVDGY